MALMYEDGLLDRRWERAKILMRGNLVKGIYSLPIDTTEAEILVRGVPCAY